MSKKIVDVKHVSKVYGSKDNATVALKDVSFTIEEEEFVGVMGASGCGKTTLLNCISTIDRVTNGEICIGDQRITDFKERDVSEFRRKELGFIFQDFNLLDTLTIKENIALALTINKEPVGNIDEKVIKIANDFGIEKTLSKFPYQVSGGEKQRASAARALITSPTLILADEPTGALDSKSSRILLETMKRMNEDMKATIMMVTHDSYAASYCNRVLFMKDGMLFHETYRGEKTRKEFFDEIMEVVSLIGGDRDVV